LHILNSDFEVIDSSPVGLERGLIAANSHSSFRSASDSKRRVDITGCKLLEQIDSDTARGLDKLVRFSHEVDVTLNRCPSIASSRAIPPVSNAIIIGVPAGDTANGWEIFKAATVVLVVDETGLAAYRTFVLGSSGESFLYNTSIMVILDRLALPRV
jgi:hypothetical protein